MLKTLKTPKTTKTIKTSPLNHIYKKKKKLVGNITTKRVARRLFSLNKYIKTLLVPTIIDNYNYRINGIDQTN